MTQSLNDVVAGRIVAFRKRARLPLRVLADRTGMGTSGLSRIETGKTHITMDHLEMMSAALGVEPSDLMPRDVASVDEAAMIDAFRSGGPTAVLRWCADRIDSTGAA